MPMTEATVPAVLYSRADLWMRRNDLGAYLLLGDPAAALTGARAVERVTYSPVRA